jgi:hypothetical protein
MEKLNKTNVIWKGLLVFYIIFISLFSFDTPFGWGLLIHLIPSLILIAGLIFFWKKPQRLGIFLVTLGILFTIFFHAYKEITLFLIIPFPLILLGALLIITNKK